MIKAREYPMRVLYMLIAVALAISLFITAAPAQQVSASPGLSEWSGVSTPTADGWVLAPESNIIDYALASAGEVAYAVAYGYDENHANEDYRLLKSDDGAATWTDLTDKLDDVIDPDDLGNDYIEELVLVATNWEDPDFVAVAVWWWDNDGVAYYLNVLFSTDGGETFIDVGEAEDGGFYFDDANEVSDLVVSYEVDGERDIAIGGMDNSGNSALFRCTVTGDSAGAWEDATDHDGWDDNGAFTSWVVTDLIFSPSWETDRTILAVTVEDYSGVDDYCYGAVYLQSGVWGEASAAWNEDAGFAPAVLVIEDGYIPSWLVNFDARAISGVSLPLDYSGTDTDTRVCWVWVNYYDGTFDMSQGEIFRVRDDAVDSVDTQIMDMPWLTNVSYLGTIAEGKAIAGVLAESQPYPLTPSDLDKECCEGVQVYRNAGITNMEICCLEWDKACKPPTGLFAMAVSYVSEDKAYAVALDGVFDDGITGYDESAWSVSFDDGNTWNQLSLIDTQIDYLSDVAASPDGDKMFLVSVNYGESCGCDSVWLKADTLPEAEGYSGKWLRTWCGQLESNEGLLELALEETIGGTIYLIDAWTDNVYWNDLETLGCWTRLGPLSSGTISGHVYQSDGITPIEGAEVYADLIDGGYGMWATTASDGSYTITTLITGQYRVRAYAEGYIEEYYDGVYDSSEATPVSVTMPDDTPNIDFTLDVGGTISGHVYQSDGVTPIEGAWVYADLVDDGYGNGASTASDGSYTITTLITGQYRVRVYAEGYIEEYYDGVYDDDEATPVSVTMPDDTPDIDFTMDLGGTMSGHVYQSDGTTPMEGVEVYADLVDGGYGMGATTASDGSYTIIGLMTGQYRVDAYAEGYIEEYYDSVYDYNEATPVSVTMPDDTPGIDFTLDLGGTISGHVYQSDGTTPIEGVWVSADLIDGGYGRGASTAFDGSYTITGLVTGQYRVGAYAEEYIEEYYDGVYDYNEATPVSVTMPDDTPDIDFTLDLGGTISGHIYEADGTTPIEGAWVDAYLIDGGYGRGASTASDGSYTVTTLVTGQYRVRAYAEGYIEEYYDSVYDYNEATPVSVTMPDDTPDIDFTLDLGGTISGHVYQSDGTTPIEGVWVYAELIDGGWGRGTTTDSDGSYTITTLVTGQYRVRAYAEGYIEEYYDSVYDYNEATPVSVTMPDDTPGIDFTLDLGGTISGHVYQSDGTTPIEGVWVYADLIDGGWGRGTTTDSDGSYTITTLITGQYRIEAQPPYWINLLPSSTTADVIQGETTTVDFVLQVGGMITGRVTDEADVGVSDAHVYAYGPGYGGSSTDEDGYYTIFGLPTGNYGVTAEPPYEANLLPDSTTVEVIQGETTTVDFVLQAGGIITGRVADEGGEGVPETCVYVYGPLYRSTYTDEEGYYSIFGLPTGNYTVTAEPPYGVNLVRSSTTAEVIQGETTIVDFVLEEGGMITGRVTDEAGVGVSDAYVYANGPGYGGSSTDEDGYYTIFGLPTGNYTVTAEPPYGANLLPDSTTAEVIQGETTVADLVLPAGGIVIGRVTDEGDVGVSNAYIYVYGPLYRSTYTDEEGYYSVFGLPTGNYTVTAEPPYGVNLVRSSTAAEVIQGETTIVDFVLQMGGMITGRVTDEADVGVSDAHVYANGPGYGGSSTDEDGYYTIFGLPTGNYTVTAEPPYEANLVRSSTAAEVIQGETTTLDFVLQTGGIVAGRVTNEVGEGVSGAYVYADGPSYGSGNTDEGGYYSIIRLETGTYTIRIYSQDCNQWYISVNNTLARYGISVLAEVVCGETTQVDFTQQPQPIPDIRVAPSSFNITLPRGGTTDRTLTIGNDGVEVLNFSITDQVGVLVTDPNEGGQIDIKQIFTSVDSGNISFLVQTYSDLPACDWSWWYEIVWLDTDQDPSTGLTEEYAQDWGVAGLNDIGADYALEVSNSQAYLYKWIGEDHWFEPVSSLPVNVNGSYLSLSIPLSEIDDDGILDYTLWQYGSDDIVPDDGHGTTKVLADWLSVLPVSGTVDPDDQTEMAVTVNATALEIGEYVGYVVIESNDLDESVTYIPVNLTVYLPIEASIDFQPDLLKLNPKAKGGFVETYIELPPGYDVRQIDISSIKFNGIVPALPKPTKVGDHDKDGIPDLMVKFSGAAVQSLLTPGDQVEITVTGEVAGIAFEGTDTIRVTNK